MTLTKISFSFRRRSGLLAIFVLVSALNDFLINPLIAPHHALERELSRAAPTSLAKRVRPLRILENVTNRIGQRSAISRWHEQSDFAMGCHFRNAAGRTGNHRFGQAHR